MKNKILPLLVLPFMLSSCMTSFNYQFNKDISYGEYHERNQFYIAAYQAYKKIPQYCPGSPLTKKAREKMIELSKMSDVKTFVEKNEKDVKIIQEKREKLDSFR